MFKEFFILPSSLKLFGDGTALTFVAGDLVLLSPD